MRLLPIAMSTLSTHQHPIAPGASAIVEFSLCPGVLSQNNVCLVGSPGESLNTGTTATVINAASWKPQYHN